MTNRRFELASCVFSAAMTLFCGACATMDSNGERVEIGSPEAGNPYGVYVPPNAQPRAQYPQNQAPQLSPMPAATPPAPAPPVTSTANASSGPSDPGAYAGDRGFSAWPGAQGPAWSGIADQNAPKISNAVEVVAAMGPAFRRCYNRALQEDWSIMGSARLTTRVGPDGHVVSVIPANVVGLPGTMIECIVARVKSAQFAPPDGGGATVVIPVSFVSK